VNALDRALAKFDFSSAPEPAAISGIVRRL
jgi:hypothetical protein